MVCVCVGFTMNLLRKNHCFYNLKTLLICSEEHSDKMNTLDFQRSYNLCLRAFYPNCFCRGASYIVNDMCGGICRRYVQVDADPNSREHRAQVRVRVNLIFKIGEDCDVTDNKTNLIVLCLGTYMLTDHMRCKSSSHIVIIYNVERSQKRFLTNLLIIWLPVISHAASMSPYYDRCHDTGYRMY